MNTAEEQNIIMETEYYNENDNDNENVEENEEENVNDSEKEMENGNVNDDDKNDNENENNDDNVNENKIENENKEENVEENERKDEKTCEIFNLGTGDGYSVLEVIKTFETQNDVKLNYTVGQRREGDHQTRGGRCKSERGILFWTFQRRCIFCKRQLRKI